jgi:hypothetical protein
VARKPRYSEPGRVYHLISRLVDRDWFVKEEEDRSYYLELLGRALKSSDWRSIGYSIMSNHFHHGMIAGRQPLSQWIRRVHSPFADWLNKKYARIGSVFVRGPKQLQVRDDGIASLLAYIHNNPVRAGVVADATSSHWTSHRAYVGIDRAPSWLDVTQGLARADLRDGRAFEEFVRRKAVDRRWDHAKDRRLVEDDKECLEFHVVTESKRIDPAQIVAATAKVLDVEPSLFTSRRRSSLHVLARHVACVAAERLRIRGVAIADAIGLSQQGVSYNLQKAVDAGVVTLVDAVVAVVTSDAA